MTNSKRATAAAIGVIGALITSQARAESAVNADAEIALLKQQLKLMEQKLDKLQKQTSANTQPLPMPTPKHEPAKAEMRPSASPTPMQPIRQGAVCAARRRRPHDQQPADHLHRRRTELRLDHQPRSFRRRRLRLSSQHRGTSPQKLDDGDNVRRARIGILGKFFGDWNYALIYDFGGSSDGFGGTGSTGAGPGVGGTASAFCPAAGPPGIENAYLSYTGFKPFGGKLAIEGGIMDLP